MIQTEEETRDGWRVVNVSGRADAEAADALESVLRAAIEANDKVAASFASLDYISSAGIRALLQAARAAQTRGSEFAVCGLSEPVRRVFDMSGLQHVLNIHGVLPC
ncbi:MAG TPA: STAS domain-containing protein [Bryobacteraceae bacterium]|nr:STAS domain-containing protein [Bryobacteraceae bacterium]